MLARDQIKQVAQEIDRTADERMRYCDDRFDQQQLWEGAAGVPGDRDRQRAGW